MSEEIWTKAWPFALVAAVVVSSGCGSSAKHSASNDPSSGGTASSGGNSSVNPNPDPDPSTPASLDALLDAVCGTLRSCCAAAGFDTAALQSCETDYLGKSPRKPYLDDGTVVLEETAFGPCMTAYQQLQSSCALDARHIAAFLSCGGLMHGTLKSGATCAAGAQCAHEVGESSVCVKVSSAGSAEPETGTCQPVAHGMAGDACDLTYTCPNAGLGCTGDFTAPAALTRPFCHLEDGVTCNTTTQQCEPLAADGAACGGDTGVGCVRTHFCDGTCQPRRPLGQPCTSSECAYPLTCIDDVCANTPIASERMCSGLYP